VRNKLAIFLSVTLVLAASVLPGFSWLSQFSGSPNSPHHWDTGTGAFPVTWNLNPSTKTNVTGSRSVHDVIAASFATWQSAPDTALSFLAEGSTTTVTSQTNSPSNQNLICFVCTDADFTQDSSTLAVTISTTADRAGESDGHGGSTKFAGQIVKADILFNPNVTYSTGSGGSGEDLQVIATHEIGHFFGLDHSAVVRAIMFPFASNMTTLSYDDVAGISTVYPSTSQAFAPGAISGHVTRAGVGVFGAHVFADSTTGDLPIGGNIRKTPIGTLTAPDGSYTIRGIPADSYQVVAEPLDDPVTKSDVDSYPSAFGQTNLQTNFTTRWH
jgi:hypothetical protein